jgi:malate dehydrogenase (oxaloacetate-decarboxylating)
MFALPSLPGPGIIKPGWIKCMAAKSVLFTCANLVPELWPWDAKKEGATIVGAGRIYFPTRRTIPSYSREFPEAFSM